MSRKTLLLIAVAAALPFAACAPVQKNTTPADLSFSQLQRLELNVGGVQVINQAQPTSNPRVQPGAALARYANRRLQAVGGEGTLNFVIQQASLKSQEGETAGDWTDAFLLSKPMEYTVTMRVGLDLVGRSTRPDIRSAFTLERKKQLAAGASLADRDRELNKLIEAMVRDVDPAVQRALADNMKILVAKGPITFGYQPLPVNEGPLVVQPGPAGAAPVVITGELPQD